VANQDHSYQAIERALRADTGVGARAGAACLDGETIAAWSSGTLTVADAARVEEHLADCARCQSMLAAFARTEPLVETPALRSVNVGRPRTHLRWLVPLATAATVAAIWVAAPQRDEPAQSPLADQRAPLETERSAPPSQAAPAPTSPAPPSLQAPSTPPSARDETAPTAERRAAPMREADVAQQRKAQESNVRPEPGVAAGQRPPVDSLLRDDRPTGAPAAASPILPPPVEGVPIAPETRQVLSKATADFASPDGSARWRIVGGQVQRSMTQGRVWEVVTLPSPATITAGHAPTASVTWLVGRAGAIFVTTDGARFERVPFPQSVDIVSILAIDGRQATVTTVDGRVYGTSDRGVSWIQP
jgi:putative zinc finger protein